MAEPQTMDKLEFEKALEGLINRHSRENASNTPDFILAKYLVRCLEAFEVTTLERESWYGRDARADVNVG